MKRSRVPYLGRIAPCALASLFFATATAATPTPALAAAEEELAAEQPGGHEIASPQEAASLASPHRVRHDGLAAFRHNPLGIFARYEAGYRYRLFESDSILLKNSYAGAALVTTLTPAFGKIGVMIESEPVAVLQLKATYEAIGYFGTFDQLQSFSGPTASYSDAVLSESGLGYATSGQQLTLGATLQAKVGGFAVRSIGSAMHFSTKLENDDSVFYDITLDILVQSGGWVFANDFDLLWTGTPRLAAGIRHSYIHASYGDAGSATIQRIGPLIAYTLADRPESRFSRPTLLLIAGWWLAHPYRTGQEVSSLMPYVVLGFTFTGDVL